MTYFPHGYQILFWKLHFDWLKFLDPITKGSSHTSRHVPARASINDLKLMKLKTNWSAESEYQQIVSRKELHDENEKKLLHRQFLEDPHQKFDKHFSKQRCGEN